MVRSSPTRCSRRTTDETGGCNVSYTLFGELGSNSVSCAETATTNFLDGIVVGDPLFVTECATMTNLVKKSGNLIFWDWTNETLPDVYAALENANVHLRGGKGYFDENTGDIETGYMKRDEQSPAIDAGDPESDYRLETVRPGCRRPRLPGQPWSVRQHALGDNVRQNRISPFLEVRQMRLNGQCRRFGCRSGYGQWRGGYAII